MANVAIFLATTGKLLDQYQDVNIQFNSKNFLSLSLNKI